MIFELDFLSISNLIFADYTGQAVKIKFEIDKKIKLKNRFREMEISKTQVQIDRGNSFYESNQPYSLFLLTIFFSIYHKCAKFHGVQKRRASIKKLARFSSSNYGHYTEGPRLTRFLGLGKNRVTRNSC